MPKIVDHEEQRNIFAQAAIRLLAREGPDGLAMRAVAAEAGLSYGSLFHYFESKEELLEHAVKCIVRAQAAAVSCSESPGLATLRRLLREDAVVDDRTRDSWVAWTIFVGHAATKPRLRRLHGEIVEKWLGTLRANLEAAQKAGDVAEGVDTEAEALALWVYAAGIGHRALLHPEIIPPRKQRRLIDAYLEKLQPMRKRRSA